MDWKKANETLHGRKSKKVANNTYLEARENGAIALRLHSTDILTFLPSGRTVASSGGWKTPTTKGRLNAYLPAGWMIFVENGLWRWARGGYPATAAALFTDGDSIGPRGALTFARGLDKGRAELQLRRQIRAYAQRYAEALPLKAPSAGDCLYCQLDKGSAGALRMGYRCDGGKPAAGPGGADHLRLHMEEECIVPSLALAALKESGNGEAVIAGAFQGSEADSLRGIAKERLPRAVARFIYRRLGLSR